jgi:hypothetical protein
LPLIWLFSSFVLKILLEVTDVSKPREGSRKGDMTVQEAGHKGGQKVKRLIQEGKKYEEQR